MYFCNLCQVKCHFDCTNCILFKRKSLDSQCKRENNARGFQRCCNLHICLKEYQLMIYFVFAKRAKTYSQLEESSNPIWIMDTKYNFARGGGLQPARRWFLNSLRLRELRNKSLFQHLTLSGQKPTSFTGKYIYPAAT